MSRKAPADVQPVELDGVRYEQVMSPAAHDLDGDAHYLRAVRISDGETLWIEPVYKIKVDSSKNRGVQSVYFETMTIDDGKILIRNEKGVYYSVDPKTGKSKKLWLKPKGAE